MAAPALARPRSRLIEQVATRPWLALAAMALASVLAVLALIMFLLRLITGRSKV